MKNFIWFWIFLMVSISSYSQSIVIQQETLSLEDQQRNGLAVLIELDQKTIEKAWQAKLKSYGKPDNRRDNIWFFKGIIDPISKNPIILYSKIEKAKNSTQVFVAIDLGTSYLNNNSAEYEPTRRFLHEFAVDCYRQQINLEIEQADKVVESAVGLHEQKTDAGSELQKRKERNKQEKERLERKLEENLQEIKKIESEIQQNKLEQETALEEINRVRKIAEAKKNKLGNIK